MKVRWRRFAELVAQGESLRAAYEQAGYAARGERAREGGKRLLARADVQAYIAEIQATVSERCRGTAELTLERKLHFLARTVLTGAGRVKPEDDWWQGYRELANGTVEVKMPCKLRALELHAKLSGEWSDRTMGTTTDGGDGLSELLLELRRRGGEETAEAGE